MYKALININPVLPGLTIENLHGDLLEVLLVLALGYLGFNSTTVDVLLQRQQNLIGVDGLDEVVGNLLSDGLVHDILFLTLGHHDNG